MVLLLAGGCARGARYAADLPQPKPLPTAESLDDGFSSSPAGNRSPGDILIPVRHPPDGLIVAREPDAHWVKQVEASLTRAAPSPLVNWSLLGLLLLAF